MHSTCLFRPAQRLALTASSARPPATARARLLRSPALQHDSRSLLVSRQASVCSGYQRTASRQRQIVQPCQAAAAAAPRVTAAVAGHFWPSLVQAWATNPAAVLLAGAACLLASALTIFLFAAIPTLLAFRRSAQAAEQLLRSLNQELPDTAAAMRLSSLDLADCIGEVTALGNDLTEGVRASARAIVSAEQGVRQGVDLAGKAMTGFVLPKMKEKGKTARDIVEGVLKERSSLHNTSVVLQEAAGATKTNTQRLRAALATARLASGAAAAVNRSARRVQQRQAPPALPEDPALGGA